MPLQVTVREVGAEAPGKDLLYVQFQTMALGASSAGEAVATIVGCDNDNVVRGRDVENGQLELRRLSAALEPSLVVATLAGPQILIEASRPVRPISKIGARARQHAPPGHQTHP